MSRLKTIDAAIRNYFIFFMLLISIAGCGGDDLAKLQFVDNLRILAIATNPVTIHPGSTTTVSALIGDPKGNGRNLTYNWQVCALANADSTGTTCSAPVATTDVVTTSTTPTFTYNNASVNPELLLITLSVTAGNEVRKGIKNLAVVPTAQNEQLPPSISTLKINGDGSAGSYIGNKGATYQIETVVGGLTGTGYFTTWLSDGGTFQVARTTAGAFTNSLSLVNVSGTYSVSAVLNDGVGGVAFITRTLQIP